MSSTISPLNFLHLNHLQDVAYIYLVLCFKMKLARKRKANLPSLLVPGAISFPLGYLILFKKMIFSFENLVTECK